MVPAPFPRRALSQEKFISAFDPSVLRSGITSGRSHMMIDKPDRLDTLYIMYEAQGAIKLINETQTFGSGFTKREFVITTDSKFPQDIKFEIVKDKCSWLDKFTVGQQVTVSFDIRGNEYNGKYYVNLNCWKIQAGGGAGGASAPSQQQGQPAQASATGNDMPNFVNDSGEPSMDDLRGDDIPF